MAERGEGKQDLTPLFTDLQADDPPKCITAIQQSTLLTILSYSGQSYDSLDLYI